MAQIITYIIMFLFLCSTVATLIRWIQTKQRLSDLISDYNELVRNRTALKEMYLHAASEHDKVVEMYNNLLDKHHALKEPARNSQFTASELKVLQFMAHPDRNNGKHEELWKKIRSMVK